MSTYLDWAGALSGPLGVGLGAYGKGWFDQRRNAAKVHKLDAEAAKIIADTAVALVAPLQDQITKLDGRVKTLETKNSAALSYIRVLLSWIHSHVPHKTPPAPPTALELDT